MIQSSENEFISQELASLWAEWGVEPAPSAAKLQHLIQFPPRPAEKAPKVETIAQVREWVGECTRCPLCASRKTIVFGAGKETPKLMFIGEGPGDEEDLSGEPFKGKSGELLDKIIEAMGFARADVYLTNIIKCHPPANRVPEREEIAQCLPFLKAQINVLQPRCVVTLGSLATAALLDREGPITPVRGKWQPLPWNTDIAVLPTYHPAYLLKNPAAKKIVWDDLKLVIKFLENANG